MTTEEIDSAYEEIKFNIADLNEEVNFRLEELGFDEDSYEEGSDEEIERLLEIWNELDAIGCCY